MWRCGGSTLSRCGDVVDPHLKCGGPHIIRIYPRMNVNLHYSDTQYICIYSHLKCVVWAISLDLNIAHMHIPIFPYIDSSFGFVFKVDVLVESSLFWSNLGTLVLHKDSRKRCSSPSTGPEHQTSFIPRRPVGSKPIQTSFMTRSREVSPSFGFTTVYVNKEKSEIVLKQEITYIGVLFLFNLEILTPTPDRVKKLVSAMNKICNGNNQAKDFFTYSGNNGIMF